MGTLRLKKQPPITPIDKKSRVIELLEAERDAHMELMKIMRHDDSRRYYAQQTLQQLNNKIDYARTQLNGAGG